MEQNPSGQARDVIVLTYGTFDLLHYGHIRLLQRARSLGSRLYVGLPTEEFCHQKGKCSIFTYEERKEMLEALSCVDLFRNGGISTYCMKKKRVVGAVHSGRRRGLYGKDR